MHADCEGVLSICLGSPTIKRSTCSVCRYFFRNSMISYWGMVSKPGSDDLQRVGNRYTYAFGTIIKSHYSHFKDMRCTMVDVRFLPVTRF
jgi:hypothetical protein